jgi:TRAP-type C4-dicarboxylate transport system substrate-binding protein
MASHPQRSLRRVGVVLAVSLALAAPVLAQDKLVIKIADPFPASHYVGKEGVQAWIAKAEELSKGKVKFEYYPAQQLGKAKDLFQLTQSGVTDIGLVAPAYTPEKVPLSVVGELPGMFTSTCDGSRGLYKISQPGGLLAQQEYTPNGLRVLFANMLAPYTVMTARGELNKFEDLAGKKVYASGGAKDIALRELGAVPVRMTGPEVYEAMHRGTIDGTMMAFVGLRPYDLHTQVKWALNGVSLGSTAILYVISEQKWQKLPPDVQKALTDSAQFAMQKLCEYSDKSNDEERVAFEKAGLKVHNITGDEKTRILKKLEPVSAEWAADLDKRGKPGTAMIKAYKDAIQAK